MLHEILPRMVRVGVKAVMSNQTLTISMNITGKTHGYLSSKEALNQVVGTMANDLNVHFGLGARAVGETRTVQLRFTVPLLHARCSVVWHTCFETNEQLSYRIVSSTVAS